jgi:hypothetical protein
MRWIVPGDPAPRNPGEGRPMNRSRFKRLAVRVIVGLWLLTAAGLSLA